MKYTILLSLIISMLMFSCKSGEEGFINPKELIICMSITEDYDKTAAKVDALKNYLEKELEMPITIHKLSNGTAIIEAIKAEKAHVGSVGAFSYLVAKNNIDITPLATTAAASQDTLHKYWSHLIVPANSDLNNIEDLKAKVGEKSLAWSYPTSTSGHLIPRGFLKSIGILPENFGEVMVSENHASAIYNCVKGKVDIAATNNITISEYVKRGKIKPEDFKIIWTSKPIMRGAFFMHNKVNPELRAKVKNALVNLYNNNPEAARDINYQYDYDIKYVPVSDSDYNSLRAIAKDIGLIE